MITARYGLGPYIKQTNFVCKGLMWASPGAQFVPAKCQIIFEFKIVLITVQRDQKVLLLSVICRTSCVSNQSTGQHNLNSTARTCFGSVTDSVTGCQCCTKAQSLCLLLNMTSLSAPPPAVLKPRSFRPQTDVCPRHAVHSAEHKAHFRTPKVLAAPKHLRRQASSLLCHYAASSGTFLATFPDSLSNPL